MPASSTSGETWRLRARTARAMVLLCLAQALVTLVPFRIWRGTLSPPTFSPAQAGDLREARRWAAHVERAAARLPLEVKCLPRAMVLSWLLARRGIAYHLVFAVRPADMRGSDDTLHARVDVAGETVIGKLPGPWIETLRLAG